MSLYPLTQVYLRVIRAIAIRLGIIHMQGSTRLRHHLGINLDIKAFLDLAKDCKHIIQLSEELFLGESELCPVLA